MFNKFVNSLISDYVRRTHYSGKTKTTIIACECLG